MNPYQKNEMAFKIFMFVCLLVLFDSIFVLLVWLFKKNDHKNDKDRDHKD